MASVSPETVANFDTAETFRMTMSFGKVLVRLLPLYVLTAVFLTFFFTVIGYSAGFGPTVTWALAIACAIPVSVLLVLVKKAQFNRQLAATKLTISPAGLEMREPYLTTKLNWDKAREVGYASMRDPLRVRLSLLGAIVVAIGSLAARRRDSAIIGAGRFTVHKDAPEALRLQIRQNEHKLGPDPQTGKPQYAIFLQHFDRDWKTGRIGDWVRAYRPDLLD